MLIKKFFPRVVSLLLTAVFAFSIGGGAFALEYDLSKGDVAVSSDAGVQKVTQNTLTEIDDAPVITTSSQTSNTIGITSDNGATANVTIKDVDIVAGKGEAAITVKGDAVITVEGDNSVTGGKNAAGIEVGLNDPVVIDGDGTLNATAGGTTSTKGTGAGIGGANKETAGSITITGDVTVTATGGGDTAYVENGTGNAVSSAGIGGGSNGAGGTIVISGNADVTATGGGLNGNNYVEIAQSAGGAGIGSGGNGANGGSIEISGNANVTAAGGYNAAGIGGSGGSDPESGAGAVSTVISTTGTVTATGGYYGAGIGGGVRNEGYDVSVSNATVIATGGYGAAGIGGGGGGANGGQSNGAHPYDGGAGGSFTMYSGNVTANGGVGAAGIGGGSGATKRSGTGGAGADVTIFGGTLKANGGMGAFGVGPGCDTVVNRDTSSVNLPGIGSVVRLISREYTTGGQLYPGTLNIYGGSGVLLGSNTLKCVRDPNAVYGTMEQLDASSFSSAYKSILTWFADMAGFFIEGDDGSIRFAWTPVIPTEPDPPIIVEEPEEPEEQPVIIEDSEIPLAETIDDEEVPLSPANGGWALMNLVFTVLTVLGFGTVLALGTKGRNSSDNDKKHKLVLKLIGAAIAVGAVIFFIATEDLTQTMIITDKWTVLAALITAVQAADAAAVHANGAKKSEAKA